MKRMITKMFIACDICGSEIESKERLDRVNFKINGKQKGFDLCWKCSEKMTIKINKLLVANGKEAYDFNNFIPKKAMKLRESQKRCRDKKLTMENESEKDHNHGEEHKIFDEQKSMSVNDIGDIEDNIDKIADDSDDRIANDDDYIFR